MAGHLSPHKGLAEGAGGSDRQPIICRPYSGPRQGLFAQKKGFLFLIHWWAASCPWALTLGSFCLPLPQMLPTLTFSLHLVLCLTSPLLRKLCHPSYLKWQSPSLFNSSLCFSFFIIYYWTLHNIWHNIYFIHFFLPYWNISSVRAGTLLAALSPAPLRECWHIVGTK